MRTFREALPETFAIESRPGLRCLATTVPSRAIQRAIQRDANQPYALKDLNHE